MKSSRPLSFAVAAAIGLAAGIGGGLPSKTLADDTEIYLGASVVKEGIRPNVLFILDTSGSMSATVKGTGMDRLDNMKVAIKKILDGVNNVNVGLMRFTDPGGPVLFPVSYIDEDVSVVEGTSDVTDLDVNVQVDQSSDDAEEVKAVTWSGDEEDFEDELAAATGVMNLTSPVLDMVEVSKSISAGGNDFETRVQDSNDDAEQYTDDGTMVMTGSRLGMGFDDGHQQAVGLRFQNVEIPKNATILSAELAFTNQSDETTQGFTLRITGHAADNPPGFTTSPWDVTNRPRTAAFVDWVDPEDWTVGGKDAYTSPDITKIVQELVTRAGWTNGNAMAFIVENAPGSVGDNDKRRNGRSYDNSTSQAPILRITWTTEANPGGVQKVGLRFRNVGIPQGAVIKKAYLEFRPDSDAPTGDSYIDIYAHDVDNAPTFTGFDNDISKRSKTFNMVDWNISDPDWTVGVPHQTPDLKDVVQEIVDRPGWCGNNAMAFILEASTAFGSYAAYNHLIGPRIANSFDSDPTNAPILRVEYDEASVATSACIDQWVQRQIEFPTDDAEQVVSNGTIQLGSTDLDFDFKKMSGMRFRDIPIAQGQKILEARIVFAADATETGVTDLVFRGQVSADAPPFEDVKNNISGRVKTSASVTWSPPDQTAGVSYVSPDLSAIVQEIVNHASWAPGNSLAIIEEHVSGAARRLKTFDADPALAPILKIKVEGQLATGGAGQNSVRTVMKEIVDNLDHIGHTPVVDTLFEAARYFRGDKVLYGQTRGKDRDAVYDEPDHPDDGTVLTPKPNASSTNEKVRRNTRVSHPASWTGGKIVRKNDCKEDDLNHDDCRAEYIDSEPVYTTPISSNCQSNYIILLTDGIANHNHSEQAIKDYIGLSDCEGGNGEKSCGKELVKWLHDEDQISALDGKQSVSTYTIGFNFSDKWLEELAVVGGGRFHEADTADDLVREVTQIFSDILNRSTSFAAPTLSVNAFNKLFHRSDVYFSLFKPSVSVRWDGNLKKYQLCQSASAGCELGEVLDANAVPAIEKDPASDKLGRIKDTALSFWSAGVDGSEIKVGGAGLEIPPPDSRTVLTYTGTAAPDDVALDVTDHQVATQASKGILDGVTGTQAERRQRTQELIGDFGYATSDDDREELFDWMLGEDIHGLEDVPSLAADGRRFAFNDPLHSSAVAVTFGGTEADPVIKLFVGTNDGGLRAVNASTGAEEWIFYPQATLLNQQTLMDNFAGKHVYGLDGNPYVWISDRDGDGIIEPGTDTNSDGKIDETEGDFVRVFIGMRRGGRNLYAVDVTPSAALTAADKDQIGDIPPTYMWRIEGGVGDFVNLGQTWSTPKVTRMVFGTDTAGETVSRTVLVFGGGYDDGQDFSFGPGGLGNAIYVVDPYDGSLLFVVSGTDNGLSNQLIVPDMDYPIPSDLALMDSTGDGATDRILVGDTGGQMWRVDIAPDLAASSPSIKPVVGKLATVSNNVDPLDRRKFFYPPDVVRVHDGAYSGTGEYNLVVAVTGNRSHPLDEEVQDRLFAFRDYVTSRLPDADDNGLADFYAPLQGPLADPPTVGDLLDVTDVIDFTDSTNLTNLENADGWYINLEGNGEKGLAAPVILGGQLFFTTYVPEGVIDTTNCTIAEGVGRLYGINVLTGAPTQNWDGVGDDTNLTKSDRTYALGSGIPSQAVPIFQPEGVTLLIGGGGGATSVNPNIGLPRERTYWYQTML